MTKPPRRRVELSDKGIIALEQRSLWSEDVVGNDDGPGWKIRSERASEAATNDDVTEPRGVNSGKVNSAINDAHPGS